MHANNGSSRFRYICEHCGADFYLTAYDKKSIHPMVDVFCSRKCILDYLKANSFDTPDHLQVCDPVVDPNGLTIYSKLLDRWFRSYFEAYVCEWLHAEKESYWYEKFGIPIGENHCYTPDLYLPERHVLIEVKGVWTPGQELKMTRFIRQYPDVKILIIPWYLHDEFYTRRNGNGRKRNH